MADQEAGHAAIEQAIYTWSSHNFGGPKGKGFSALSPGLRSRVQRVLSWPREGFVVAPDQWREQDGFDGWREAVTVGSFAVDDLNVVYRKMPAAGTDAHERTRSLVHALVAPRSILDISRLPIDASIWLDAESCPLNKLPTLTALAVSDLPTLPPDPPDGAADSPGYDEAELEALVAGLRVDLVAERQAVDPSLASTLLDHILAAIPVALWPDLEVRWHLGSTGLDVTARMADRMPVGRLERRVSGALARSDTHRRVEDAWTQLPASRRTWAGLVSRLRMPPPKPARTSAATTTAATASRSGQRGRDEESAIVALVSRAIGITWLGSPPLDDTQLTTSANESDFAPAVARWLPAASGAMLRAVFADAANEATFVAIRERLASVSTADLAAAWRRSVAAPLGHAAAHRPDIDALEHGWAAPSQRPDGYLADTRLLVRHLAGEAAGRDALVRVFSSGLEGTADWRDAIIAACLGEGDGGFVFDTLVPSGNLSWQRICALMVREIDAFADWLQLPDVYASALKKGLARRSLLARLLARDL